MVKQPTINGTKIFFKAPNSSDINGADSETATDITILRKNKITNSPALILIVNQEAF